MKFLAPEYLSLMLGIFVILAIYIFVRRRVVVRTGFYNLWLEAAQELGYIKKVRFRKLMSILLAMIIFSLIVMALMQPTPITKDTEDVEKTEKKTFVYVDTFYETFPTSAHCIALQKIIAEYAKSEIKGKLIFEDTEGVHIRSFKESSKIDWSKHLTFTKPKIAQIIENTKDIIDQHDEILVVTLNEGLCEESFKEAESQLMKRIQFVKIPENNENSEITDIEIQKIEQSPEFPFEAREIEVFIKKFSVKPEQAQLILHPGGAILRTLELEYGETSVRFPIQEVLSNIEHLNNEITFVNADETTDFSPLYYQKLKEKYSVEAGIPMIFELRKQSDLKDIRPANNFSMCCLDPSKPPRISVIGEDANNEYAKLLFRVFQETKRIEVVKLSDSPEIVVQLGKTELSIPEDAHLIRFESGLSEYDSSSAFFWKNTDFIEVDALQKFFFSLKKVSYQLAGSGDIILNSPGGILGKVIKNTGRYEIHFSFSVNPENSDFLLRSEIAPALFSRMFNALTKDNLKITVKPEYSTQEKIEFWANKNLDMLEISNFDGSETQEYIDFPKNTINFAQKLEKPGFYQLKTQKHENYIAVNPIMSDIDLKSYVQLKNFEAPKAKINEKQTDSDDDKYLFLLIFVQIAFLLVLIETVLFIQGLTE